jgi:hypothetical protein
MNLIAAFDGAIRKHSDKMFLRSGDVFISYGEIKARSHLAAAELRRFIQKKIVWIQVAEGLAPRHWCLLIPGRRPALLSIAISDT